MSKIMGGFVIGVTKYANGDIVIDFIGDDEMVSELHYFIDLSKTGELPKEIAYTLSEILDRNIWAEISFDENDVATSVKLEEADLEEDSEY